MKITKKELLKLIQEQSVHPSEINKDEKIIKAWKQRMINDLRHTWWNWKDSEGGIEIEKLTDTLNGFEIKWKVNNKIFSSSFSVTHKKLK